MRTSFIFRNQISFALNQGINRRIMTHRWRDYFNLYRYDMAIYVFFVLCRGSTHYHLTVGGAQSARTALKNEKYFKFI